MGVSASGKRDLKLDSFYEIDESLYIYRRRVYCSVKCKNRGAIIMTGDRCCEYCGKKFSRRHSPYNNECQKQFAGRKYCSHECAQAGRIKKFKQMRCLYCGEIIARPRYGKKRALLNFTAFGLRKFCNQKCRGKYTIKMFEAKKKIVDCIYCGKRLYRKLHKDCHGVKKREWVGEFIKRKFCNHKCRKMYLRFLSEKRKHASIAARNATAELKNTARVPVTMLSPDQELRESLRRDVLCVAKNLSG